MDSDNQSEFQGDGTKLLPIVENDALVYSLGSINDDSSWVWDIFEKPFQFDLLGSVASFSSSLLELIDFAGSGNSFGIGIDGDMDGGGFDRIRLDMTVRPYEQGGKEKTLTASIHAEDFSDADLSNWTVVDQGGLLGPSNWTVVNGELVQATHIYSDPTAPGTLRKGGTFLKYNLVDQQKNYLISLKMRSQGVNDCGVMFRLLDENTYYRFSWNSQAKYSRLVKVNGGVATLLAEKAQGYVQGKTYQILIAVSESQMRVYVDGELWLAGNDNAIPSGTIGLYCWGNAPGTYFDDIIIEEEVHEVQSSQENQILIKEMFNDTGLNGWTVVDQGTLLGPSNWSVVDGVLSQTTHIYSNPTAPS
ncbi:MAG: DUF1080 domain-containing protein, partial [Sedimentisphaerales bacterium]|nr:DUF1080 domain-containing protein [Sedimentisphaerales bacterium]